MAYQCFSDNPPSLFDNIDLLARHSDDGAENAKGGELSPSQFDSLSEYVLAVAERTCTTCQLDGRRVKILSDRLGLLNVRREKTLEEMGAELEVSRERVRQISSKLESGLFSGNGKAMFARFVDNVKEIFARHNWVIKSEDLSDEVNDAYGWTGTTAFSVRKLLGYCGMNIEHNDSNRDAWMSDGRIVKRYNAFLGILNDEKVSIESLAQEEVLKNASALGLEGITEDEYMFLVYRAFDRDLQASGENKSRWSLFLKLRCGMYVGDAAMRRYSVARALRRAGMRGLTHAELADACLDVDSVDIGEELLLKADANPIEKFDMDGTGARLLIYDFGDATHERRYSLDVFFKDEELVRVIAEAGNRLRRHMEENSLGAANITRLVDEINDCLPEPYASEGLPSACIYWLMREHNAGGLKYYDHPNVAHRDILDDNGNPPQKALSWVLYKYFQKAGHETATWGQLIDFCEVMLGMNREIAAATAMPPVMGDKVVVDGESQYRLKAPADSIEPPNVLLDGGKIYGELTFSGSRLLLGMETTMSVESRSQAEGRVVDYLQMALSAFEARRWKDGFLFAELTNKKDARIQYYVGCCHKYGEGTKENLEEAFRWYKKSAEQGHSDAQCCLAEMYANGSGAPWDMDKAIYWYRKSAAQGNEDAIDALRNLDVRVEAEGAELELFSDIDDESSTVEADDESDEDAESVEIDAEGEGEELVARSLEAFKKEHWAMGMVYAEKTDKSDLEIQFYMGYCYENGLGTEKDGGEAFRWYDKAVVKGHVKAMLRLAGMYERGDWVDYNLEEAARLYVCAAIKGDGEARQKICELAEDENSIEAVVCQVKNAFEKGEWAKVVWIAFLTNMTDARLQYYIGYCCENGLGMEKDQDAARAWYRKSAEHFIFKHIAERD